MSSIRSKQRFYAHSTLRNDKSDWQGLAEHLNGVGTLAGRFAAIFGAEPLARVAGLLHDLGKYTQPYQERLSGGPRVDHATWGARIVKELYPGVGDLLAFGIAGHHVGLANGRVGRSRMALEERLALTLPQLFPTWKEELSLPPSGQLWPIPGFSARRERAVFQLSLLGRMLFSCLVDADFIDTDEFYRHVEGRTPRSLEVRPTLTQLRERLEVRLAGFRRDSAVNRLRADVLAHVRGQAGRAPGRFSLTVPTGGGKTLASLAFALDHAIAHGLRRVIYVIPFTSIVEQTAQVFRDAFGELGAASLLEHHGAFDEDPKTAWESKEKRRLAMENWDAPVIVTTAVQFFESLFAARPSRCRKLHNIAGSVVILDEAQTLPLKLLRPCVTVLDELAQNYRVSLVLCTATQPALREDEGFRAGFRDVYELAPDPLRLYDSLRRARVRHIGALGDDALAEQLRRRDQVLCIVNNRRHARALYASISEQEGARHLSTLMHARHRRQVLSEVRQRLKDGLPCRLVSTSLIEAGVDVDFPMVFRAEAGLDSIAQAAGRCNREGRRPLVASETQVFATSNPDWAPPLELRQFAQVFRSICRRHAEDLLAPEAIRAYFQELYWQKGNDALDAHALLDLLRSSGVEGLPFETLAEKFRFIETATRPVIAPFDPATGEKDAEVMAAMRSLEDAPALARRVQPFLVQVPQSAFSALLEVGAIEPVRPRDFGEQFMQLVRSEYYDARFGLHWESPAFVSAEKSLW